MDRLTCDDCRSERRGPAQGDDTIVLCPLHAAAPSLYEALREAEQDYAHMCDEDDAESEGARLLRKMRAALALVDRG